MKKFSVVLALYIVMMFYTNAFCQVYRWKDWAQNGTIDATNRITLATLFWPAYWGSRVSVFTMDQTNRIQFEYRREEAEERRKKMQHRSRIESQQTEAWEVMDDSLGLQPRQMR